MHTPLLRRDDSSLVVRPWADWSAALRIAIAADPDPEHLVAHESTIALLDRHDRVGTGDLTGGWDRLAVAANGLMGKPGWGLTVGVMANMIALVEFAEAADFATASNLVQRHGHRMIAAIQTTIDDLLDTGPAMPVATRVAIVLSASDVIAATLGDAGTNQSAANEIAERCRHAGFRLVMSDIDLEPPGPRLTTPQELVQLWEHGGIRAWRGQLAIISATPWSRYQVEINRLAVKADRPACVAVLTEASQMYRDRNERREREEVSREIKMLVAASGRNQRQFASMIGTSPSRLSTYANGLVTPSAAMMVRMRRVSAIEEQRARGLGVA